MKMSVTDKANVICLPEICVNSRGKGTYHTSLAWKEYIGGSIAYG